MYRRHAGREGCTNYPNSIDRGERVVTRSKACPRPGIIPMQSALPGGYYDRRSNDEENRLVMSAPRKSRRDRLPISSSVGASKRWSPIEADWTRMEKGYRE